MEGALEVRISDEEVLSNEEMLIERYNDQWALIENKKIQYQLFKGKYIQFFDLCILKNLLNLSFLN